MSATSGSTDGRPRTQAKQLPGGLTLSPYPADRFEEGEVIHVHVSETDEVVQREVTIVFGGYGCESSSGAVLATVEPGADHDHGTWIDMPPSVEYVRVGGVTLGVTRPSEPPEHGIIRVATTDGETESHRVVRDAYGQIECTGWRVLATERVE